MPLPPSPPKIVEVLVDIGLEISGVIFVVDAITKSVAVFVGWITMTCGTVCRCC